MSKVFLLGANMEHDRSVQVVKVNQVVILNHTITSEWVVYKIEENDWGIKYHVVSLKEPHFLTVDLLRPLRQKFGIGWYYDDETPEFKDAFEVAILVQQAQEKTNVENAEQEKERKRVEGLKTVGSERLKALLPSEAKAVIIASLKENESDSQTDYFGYRKKRTVILGFSTHTKNIFSEMRKFAANFEDTKHLAEYNPENEHRENYTGGYGYYLAEGRYSGWTIEKEGIHTPETFIERYAVIAGNEDNICVTTISATLSEEQTETISGDYIIVDYSEKAIAIFGDTKPVKDQLSALGGRFNGRLTHNGEKKAGWIFQKSKETQVRQLLGINE